MFVSRLDLRRRTLAPTWDGGVEWHCVDIELNGRGLDAWIDELSPRDERRERIGIHRDDIEAALRGDAAAPDGRTELRLCGCMCSGCDSLTTRVDVGEWEVVWDDFAEGCLDDALPGVEFRFTREDYERALARFAEV